ncbi:MAG: peptidoglycan DD-metalloendopeptidase family protein [Bacteroidota bacterium]
MQRLTFYFLGILFVGTLIGCSQFNKAKDLITKPSAKEQYQREFSFSQDLFSLWENQVGRALKDSLQIELPYFSTGNFTPRGFLIYSYNVSLNPGEQLEIGLETASTQPMVFIDLFLKQDDSIQSYKNIASAPYKASVLTYEIKEKGTYKIIVQPAMEANSPFVFKVKKSPVYLFPVSGAGNKNMQSFWGAGRDAGRRSHEGIDIFASRGTPVVAAINGHITSSGEKGLGGKQVWLRDPKRSQSLYYAHLDSIEPILGKTVKRGDTLGYVGNTGNAKTTSPHLHFGIYKNYQGAIDPLYHIFQVESPEYNSRPDTLKLFSMKVTGNTANLRDKPNSRSSIIIGNSKLNDTLIFLGKSNDWYHIRTLQNQAAFIHKNLVAPL